MNNEYGYCEVCGTPLEAEKKWEENTSGYGPAGREYIVTYCPECREAERLREEHKRFKEEQERLRIKEEQERERESKRLKRLEKYKKYMPKKVTAIVLTYQEAKHLYEILDKEIKQFQRTLEIDNDNVYVDELLIEKLKKAKEETDYTFKESYEFAKGKGWEKD